MTSGSRVAAGWELSTGWMDECPDTTQDQPHLTFNLQQTKNETTNVVINIIVASS